MKISSDEKGVLEALEGLSGASPEEVAEASGLSRSEVLSLAETLKEKGLARVEVESEERYRLGPEGEEAADEGLPERRLLESISPEGERMADATSREGANVAIGWLKRKGWADISNGTLVPTEAGRGMVEERGLDERALSALADGPSTARELAARLDADPDEVEEALEDLRGRGDLVERSEETRRRLEITGDGEEALRHGAVVEEVRDLTHEMLVEGSWREKEFKSYDVTAEAERASPGKIHPYRRILERMRNIFVSLGFQEIKSPTVESGFWNFDALFQPQDHPAREMQDTFYLAKPGKLELPPERVVDGVRKVHKDGGDTGSTGWGGDWMRSDAERAILRTHTTSATIRYLYKNPEPPAKVFCIDRAYRRETIDATHLPQFYQLEGIVMDRDVSFKNLLGALETFYSEMGFTDVRFRPAYFPYTEPSVEPEVYVEELGEWVELGGAGIFREEVTEPAGVDHPVLAWGLGAGRLAMLRLGLTDLRDLYISDVNWLKEEPTCR